MILALILFIPLLIVSIVLFFKLSPKDSDFNKVQVYNISTIVVAILISIIFALRVRASMMSGIDFAWWPMIALIFTPVILIATFFISGILRNLIFFRNKKR